MNKKSAPFAAALLGAFVAAAGATAAAQQPNAPATPRYPAVIDDGVAGCQRVQRVIISNTEWKPDETIRAACLSDITGRIVIRDQYRKDGETYRVTETDIGTNVVTYQEFKEHGSYTDGPNGEPARQFANPDGTIVSQVRYQHGLRTDGPNGEYALAYYNDEGGLIHAEHWKDGQRNDAGNVPAVQEFSDNGTRTLAEHYANGKLTDTGGEYARQKFAEDGTLISAESWKDGQFVKVVDAKDLAARQGAPKTPQLAALPAPRP